jgi:hypothetical protein
MAKVSKGYSLTHAYKRYRERNKNRKMVYDSSSKEYVDIYKVSAKEYRDICKSFNDLLVDEVLTGRAVKLPHSVGMLWGKKFKMNWNKPPIDLNESKKTGWKQIIYHLNEHSDGWCAMWKWSKRNNLITNLQYYSFFPTWTNSNKMSKILKEEGGYRRFFVQQCI